MQETHFARATDKAAAPARHECSAQLPFRIALGPYRLAVEFRPAGAMLDRRRLTCINIDEHRIELRQDLHGMRLAEAFLACLIRLTHFSRGCQEGCVEEAYAHSFATGIVEFALRNPRAWLWFNLLLSEHQPGRVGFDRVVRGVVRQPPSRPRRLLVGGMPVKVRVLSRQQTGSAFGWYDLDQREVQLFDGLNGTNLPVVALHEITHAVHQAHGLDSRASHRQFQRAELRGWLGVIRHNPAAWRWLLWCIRGAGRAGMPLQ